MNSLKSSVIANYLGRAWTAIIGIVLVPVYIKFMGIEAYGLIGVFTTISSVLGLLDLGIGATINRELARRSIKTDGTGSQRDVVRTLELIYWALSLIAGLFIFFLAPLIAHKWINSQDIKPETLIAVVRLMGISIAIQLPMSLYQGGLVGLQRQVLVNILLASLATLRGVGAILVLMLVSPTITVFFQWQIFVSIISSLMFLIVIWKVLPKSSGRASFNRSIVKDVWKYAAAISLNALIGVILTQLDKVILSKMLSLKMFAYYSIATTVSSAIWMIIIPFNTAIFPTLVQLYEKQQFIELKLFFHKSSQILAFILFPICAVLILFSGPILNLWMKDIQVAQNCHLIASLLVFGTMLNGIVSLPANGAPAFGWPLLITYTNLIQAVLIIPLIIGLVYLYQGIGAGIAWIIINSVYIFFMTPVFFGKYLMAEKKEWYLRDIFFPGITAFSVCIISYALFPKLNSNVFNFAWIIVTGIVALIVTGMVLPTVKEIFFLQIKKSFKLLIK